MTLFPRVTPVTVGALFLLLGGCGGDDSSRGSGELKIIDQEIRTAQRSRASATRRKSHSRSCAQVGTFAR